MQILKQLPSDQSSDLISLQKKKQKKKKTLLSVGEIRLSCYSQGETELTLSKKFH